MANRSNMLEAVLVVPRVVTGPEALGQGCLVGKERTDDAVAADVDGPSVLTAGDHALAAGVLDRGAGRDELVERRRRLDADLGEQVLVDEHAAVGRAAERNRVDAVVVRPALDGRFVVVVEERLAGEVLDQSGVDQLLPGRRIDAGHVVLHGLVEAGQADRGDVDVLGGQACLVGGGEGVGLDDRQIDR